MLKLDVIGTLVMMILVGLMPIAKREMMRPYALAHQVDMTKNSDKNEVENNTNAELPLFNSNFFK